MLHAAADDDAVRVAVITGGEKIFAAGADIKEMARLARNKKDVNGLAQGVVAWDVEVSNQHAELAASYDILTLVAKRN